MSSSQPVQETLAAMFIARRSLVLLATVVLIGTVARAQATATAGTHRNGVSLALTYDTQGSNLTNTNRFWLQGGGAELNASVFRGLGATASVLGLHSANSSGGVPVNLIAFTFGPSYTYTHHYAKHTLQVFGHGLVGEADGFNGIYPEPGAPISSSNSLAVVAGGGVDLGLSRHLAVRLVQADYVRSQLPNSLSNVQNSLRLGIGIVLR